MNITDKKTQMSRGGSVLIQRGWPGAAGVQDAAGNRTAGLRHYHKSPSYKTLNASYSSSYAGCTAVYVPASVWPARRTPCLKHPVQYRAGLNMDQEKDSQGVPLLRDEVAGDGQHSNASVLELHCAAPEKRCVVLAVAERVKHTVRLDVRTEHVVNSHLGRGGCSIQSIACRG